MKILSAGARQRMQEIRSAGLVGALRQQGKKSKMGPHRGPIWQLTFGATDNYCSLKLTFVPLIALVNVTEPEAFVKSVMSSGTLPLESFAPTAII